jgi:DNA-binding beta-propeller fold protein YncE
MVRVRRRVPAVGLFLFSVFLAGDALAQSPPPPYKLAPTVVSLATNDMVYDQTRGVLYASVAGTSPVYTGSIVTIDPASGAILATLSVGQEPGRLAVSDDGSRLYVGVNAAVQPVDLTSGTLGTPFALAGAQPFLGPSRPFAMAVLPGQPLSVAVSGAAGSFPTVAIYDSGVPRATLTKYGTPVDALVAGPNPGTLYGYNNEDTGYDLSTIQVDGSGATIVRDDGDLIQGFSLDIRRDGSRIYASSGHVVDVSGAAPLLVGKFALASPWARAVAPAASQGCIFFAEESPSGSGDAVIEAFDPMSFTRLYTIDPVGVTGTPLGALFVSGTLVLRTASQVAIVPNAIQYPTWTATPYPTAGPASTTRLALPANDLVYDASRDLLYASIPSTQGSLGNRVAVIDSWGDILLTILVGSEPTKLALSDDAQFLYVGLYGAGAVARIDLQTFSVGLQFPLGTVSYDGAYVPASMAVLPGQPHSLAVSRRVTASTGVYGAAIYDDGVPRPTTPAYPASFDMGLLLFDPVTDIFWAFNNTSTGFELYQLSVNAQGVTVKEDYGQIFGGFFEDWKIEGPRIYSALGQVVDVSGLSPVLAGRFALQNWQATVVPDSSVGRVFFAESRSKGILVEEFDPATFLKVGELDMDGIPGNPRSLQRTPWGLAFLTDAGEVVLATNVVATSATPAVPTPQTGPAGTGTTVLSLATNDLVYDAGRGVLYASVPSTQGALGNSVAVIDPATGNVTGQVFVGSEPGKLAITDDGSRLYVGLDGRAAVSVIDLASMTPGTPFSIGGDSFMGPYHAAQLAPVPGSSTDVAVVLFASNVSPADQGAALYSNGVLLPQQTTRSTWIDQIGFASSSVLYGIEFGDLDIMPVTTAGIGVKTTQRGLLRGSMVVAGPRIYTTVGQVLDGSKSPVVLAGTCALGTSYATAIAPDGGRVYFAERGSKYELLIEAFDAQSFARVGSADLTGLNVTAQTLVRAGPQRLALRDDQNRVVIVTNGSLVP